jgi:L-cysteate sulfo-lyase
MLLARFPRVRMVSQVTPLEYLPRLTEWLDCGAKFWVKRDDSTGLAGGGNKARKLEFLVGDAIAQGADTLITQGAVQSNHVRQTAAAAARFGLGCRAVLERRVPNTDADFEVTGNVFLNHLLGIESLRFVDDGADMAAELSTEAELARRNGRKPYVIPGGGSNAIGALGYVQCALELVTQANERDLRIDWVVHATGSSGTQAGLAAGFSAINAHLNLLGISVRQRRDAQIAKVAAEANSVADHIGNTRGLKREDILVDDAYVDGGYGIAGEITLQAIVTAARLEALLLDPTYTGKAFAGLVALTRSGRFKAGENVVFVHTGGAQGLFAYVRQFAGVLSSQPATSLLPR